MVCIVNLAIFTTSFQVFAEPSRVSSAHSNLSLVDKIFLSPGRVSLIEFPQNIIEVRVGNPRSVKALISQVSPKEFTVYLASGASVPSNLIVRSEKKVFVFDVVPSKNNHQDYIKIRGAFGTPNFTQPQIVANRIEITPQEPKRKPKAIVTKSKTLKVGP